jgi:hypothetical protein
MQTLDQILDMARKLPAEQRQHLIEELDALDQVPETRPDRDGDGPYSALLALAGTVRSDFSDLATNKYEHVAAAVSEHKRG